MLKARVIEIFENDITHLTKIITQQDLRSELLPSNKEHQESD
jgi:hypothetical protein